MRRAAVYLCLAGIVFFALFPIAWALSTSLKPQTEIFDIPTTWIPKQITFENFRDVWESQPVGRQFRNSLIVAMATTALATTLATLAAYGLSRFPFRNQGLFLRLVLIGQMFPAVLLILPYFIVMRRLGLINSYAALILAYSSFALPLATWMLRGYFMSVPTELDDAAMVDGSNRLQAMFYVVLPVAVPGIAAAMIFTFMVAWSEYLFALVLTTDRSMQVMTVGIGSLIRQYGIQWNQLMALGIIAIIPIAVVFLFLERFLVTGLTGGAVRG